MTTDIGHPPVDQDQLLIDELATLTFDDVSTAVSTAIVPMRAPEGEQHDLEARFLAFHHANPWVYARLRLLALDMVERGHEHIGIKMLWEVLRWQVQRSTVSSDGFKLNNDLTSRYARLLAANEPALVDVFRMRVLRST